MCARRLFKWSIRAGRSWPINWMVFRPFWKHSLCTWRWQLLFCNLPRGEHLRPTLTTLVKVISLPLWPITCIALACAGGWLWTVREVEWWVLIELRRAWKWFLWRRVTIAIQQMILISLFPQSTSVASGSSWTTLQLFWSVFTALLSAK